MGANWTACLRLAVVVVNVASSDGAGVSSANDEVDAIDDRDAHEELAVMAVNSLLVRRVLLDVSTVGSNNLGLVDDRFRLVLSGTTSTIVSWWRVLFWILSRIVPAMEIMLRYRQSMNVAY